MFKPRYALLLLAALAAGTRIAPSDTTAPQRFTMVIHGGAGADPKTMREDERRGVEARLQSVLVRGQQRLAGGDAGLDVLEEAIRSLEDDPLFNAGRGAALNHEGEAELDASIMNGATLKCGAVAGVRRVKNPISLARKVLEQTPHVLLVGNGADAFGAEQKLELVDPSYFVTPAAREALDKKRKASQGTVGCVILDRRGNLVAGTSTGGLTDKRVGRVGDSPIIGAGTYANNKTCAVSCTGVGEEFIRHGVAAQVSARMRFQNLSLKQSVDAVFKEDLPADVGGIIAVDHQGTPVLQFNTPGMARGYVTHTSKPHHAIGPE